MTDGNDISPGPFPALPAGPGMPGFGSAGASQPPWEGEEEKPVDLRRILAALRRHMWLVVGLGTLGLAVGIVLTRVVPSQYLAQATLWLQVGNEREGARQTGPIQPSELLQWSSWVDLLRSFVVLDEVVRRQHVYLEPDDAADSTLFQGFQLATRFAPGKYSLKVARDGRSYVLESGGREVQRGQVGDSVGSAFGLLWQPAAAGLPPGRDVGFRVRTPREAALKLRDGLRTVLPQQGSFLRLELEGNDPVATTGVVNAIGDRFVEVAAELKRQKLTELSTILREQLNSSYADLGRAESSLESFRVHTITLPSEQASPVTPGLEQTRDPVFRAFFDMRVQREQLDRDRDAILQVLARPDSGVSSVQLEAIEAVRASGELSRALTDLTNREAEARAMRLQFTEAHPPLQRLMSEISQLRTRTIPDLARGLAAELATRVQELDSRVGSASRELQQIPTRAIEEARLRRDVMIAENLYTTLQQRYEEARLAEVSSIPDVRVLDRAVVPEQPLKDKAIMLLFGGLLGGLGAGIGLVLLLDRLDRRVRYPEQVTLGMGLAVLGAVPRLHNRSRPGTAAAEAQVVEALRTIRLNLMHAYGSAGPLVITVTSPGSGDGKSFLSSNLAVSFADAGHRTLLIDADVRRGTLHRVLSIPRKPGLLDYLGGGATREQIVHATSIAGVDFIPSGTRKNAGPEMLASATMSQFLISLRTAYSVIIVDSAPLGGGVDALILGALTGNLVLVLRTGVTDREFTMAKLEAVSRLPIRVLGAVLNDVKPEGAYAYYAYLPGYATTEETGDDGAQPKRLPKGS